MNSDVIETIVNLSHLGLYIYAMYLFLRGEISDAIFWMLSLIFLTQYP